MNSDKNVFTIDRLKFKRIVTLFLIILLTSSTNLTVRASYSPQSGDLEEASSKKPNILLIVSDDLKSCRAE